MNKWIISLCFLCMAACKNKETTTEYDKFFPVLSFLKGQAKNIDTSLYRIVNVETQDSISTTTYVKREDFHKYAKDFLDLPDITSRKWKGDYEETKMFDETLNKVILTYTTKDKNNEVQREDVMLEPNTVSGNSEVQNIVITTFQSNKDSSIEKNMVWHVNKRFIVITKVQIANQPEKIKKQEVIWNDFLDPTQM